MVNRIFRSQLWLHVTAVALMVMGVAGISSPAFADTSRYICLQNTTQRCLDNPANGDQVQIDNGYLWTEHEITTIGNGVSFTGSASHFNNMFSGAPVIQLQNPSGTNCIRTNASDNIKLTTGGCGTRAYIIEWGNWLVNYSVTNEQDVESIIEATETTKGAAVEVFTPKGSTDWAY